MNKKKHCQPSCVNCQPGCLLKRNLFYLKMPGSYKDIDFNKLDELRRNHLGRLLLRAYRVFSSQAVEKLEKRGYEGISTAHTMMLMNIDMKGMQLTQLGEKIGISRQAITNLVQSMEQKGYLIRSADPSDKRASIVSLTKSGWELIKDIVEIKGEIEEEYCTIVGNEQMSLLRKSLVLLFEEVEKK